MTSGGGDLALRARYVFPVDRPVLERGTVHIAGGKIVCVEDSSSRRSAVDLGNVAIVPGLVNAHTHLEFSDLTNPLGPHTDGVRWLSEGVGFGQWIQTVVQHRRRQQQSLPISPSQQSPPDGPGTAIAQGIRESLAAGVTSIGEIATIDNDHYPASAEIQLCLLRELLGWTPQRVASQAELAARHLADDDQRLGSVGLSPHAPYTVSIDLLRRAVALSRQRRCVIAMHLAESREELQLLQSGNGPLVEALRALGAWDKAAITPFARPLDYLRVLGQAERALVVHGNYLDSEELAFLARHRHTMSVAYCGRTHAWFGHSPYPLSEMLRLGIRVALGTDSRASNPDLNLLREMRYVAATHPGVEPASILRMATIDGAIALGIERTAGSLSPGKPGDLAIIALPQLDARDPHELLFASELPVQRVYIRGRVAHALNNPR